MAKILSIVETAYRATLEEQDDTIVWLNSMFKNAGAEVSLLLRSNAVNYALKQQNASGLQFGEIKQKNPPEIEKDISKLIQKGVPVYVVGDDLAERGIPEKNLIEGIKKIQRNEIAQILDQYDHVWHW